jgi:hypothetical protein
MERSAATADAERHRSIHELQRTREVSKAARAAELRPGVTAQGAS